jgi:hypothetical protein
VSLRRYRIRLIGQLVRPTLRRLRKRGKCRGIGQERCSCHFFRLLNTSRRPTARRRPKSRSCTLGSCGIPSAQPRHAVPRGRHSPNYRPSLPGLPARHRVVALIGVRTRRGAVTRPAHRAMSARRLAQALSRRAGVEPACSVDGPDYDVAPTGRARTLPRASRVAEVAW